MVDLRLVRLLSKNIFVLYRNLDVTVIKVLFDLFENCWKSLVNYEFTEPGTSAFSSTFCSCL